MTQNLIQHSTGKSGYATPLAALGREIGFTCGTIILTQDGEMPVEYLTQGDRIITRDSGFATLADITQGKQLVRAISFAAGSLGHTRPDHDVILPAAQPVLVRDWRAQALFGSDQAIVRADALVDGEFVTDLGLCEMLLFQLHFERCHVLYAGGMELFSGDAPTQPRRKAA